LGELQFQARAGKKFQRPPSQSVGGCSGQLCRRLRSGGSWFQARLGMPAEKFVRVNGKKLVVMAHTCHLNYRVKIEVQVWGKK
jgi:hypothetical protein